MIQVKEKGRTGFSKGWQGCPEGFPEGEAKENIEEQPCQPKEKPCPTRLFFLDLDSIWNRTFWRSFWIFQILIFEEA